MSTNAEAPLEEGVEWQVKEETRRAFATSEDLGRSGTCTNKQMRKAPANPCTTHSHKGSSGAEGARSGLSPRPSIELEGRVQLHLPALLFPAGVRV